MSSSAFYKWVKPPSTPSRERRADLDAEVLAMFDASGRNYGSPRIHADLLEAGWSVSVNTVADSMRRQGLQGRKPKHSAGLTRQDKKAPKFPDLLKRDFAAPGPNRKWCGDITEIPGTAAGEDGRVRPRRDHRDAAGRARNPGHGAVSGPRSRFSGGTTFRSLTRSCRNNCAWVNRPHG